MRERVNNLVADLRNHEGEEILIDVNGGISCLKDDIRELEVREVINDSGKRLLILDNICEIGMPFYVVENEIIGIEQGYGEELDYYIMVDNFNVHLYQEN